VQNVDQQCIVAHCSDPAAAIKRDLMIEAHALAAAAATLTLTENLKTYINVGWKCSGCTAYP
jgi:hypothetical protein